MLLKFLNFPLITRNERSYEDVLCGPEVQELAVQRVQFREGRTVRDLFQDPTFRPYLFRTRRRELVEFSSFVVGRWVSDETQRYSGDYIWVNFCV